MAEIVLTKSPGGAPKRSKLFALRSYNAWRALKERCLNPGHQYFKYYGGAGIKVCEAWLSYDGFVADMGEPEKHMQIDRIDPSGDYCKENCRWVTPSQNVANRRGWGANGFKGVFVRPSGRFAAVITINGKSKVIGTFDTIIEAARAFDVAVVARHGEFALTNEKLGKFDDKNIHA